MAKLTSLWKKASRFFTKAEAVASPIPMTSHDVEAALPNESKPSIPVIKLKEILSEEILVPLLEPMEKDGHINLLELLVINQLVKKLQPKKIFEIGTFDGRTTLNMAASAPKDSNIFTLDLPPFKVDYTKLHLEYNDRRYIEKPASGILFKDSPYHSRIQQLYGDSATFDFSPFNESIDFVFVDGSHSYEYVINDTMRALEISKKQHSIILWHDYASPCWPGLQKALDELYMQDARLSQAKHIEGTKFLVLFR